MRKTEQNPPSLKAGTTIKIWMSPYFNDLEVLLSFRNLFITPTVHYRPFTTGWTDQSETISAWGSSDASWKSCCRSATSRTSHPLYRCSKRRADKSRCGECGGALKLHCDENATSVLF